MDKRISRKELLKGEDPFMSVAHSTGSWAKTHRGTIVKAVLAILVVFGGVMAVESYRNQSAAKTAHGLAEGMAIYRAEIASDPTQANPNATPPTFASEEAKRAAAKAKFEEVVKLGGGEHALAVAQFYLGTLHEQAGEAAAAIEAFDAAINDLNPQDSLYFLAIERLADLKESQGDRAGAVTVLSRLVGKGDGKGASSVFYREHAALHQARLLVAEGNKEQARQILKQLQTKEDLNDAIKDDVQAQLESLGDEDKATPPAAALPKE